MTSPMPTVEGPILVTGCAGFIGFHLADRLLAAGHDVVGVDNLNDYYDVSLKEARLDILKAHSRFRFHKIDLSDTPSVDRLFDKENLSTAIHLAAQAGVRYSLVNPRAYMDANFLGFFNVLDASKRHHLRHLVFASSSSVYGLNTSMPFSVHDNVDHPISLYAASKKSNELMAHTYAHLFNLPVTGLRFFTVYGPWGRPDMAMFKFSRSILLGEPLTLFNGGNMERDFTFVDDIVEGVIRAAAHLPSPNQAWNSDDPDPGTSPAPFRIYNIGRGKPANVKYVLDLLTERIGRQAIIEDQPMQPGDVAATWADIDALVQDIGYEPRVSVEEGVNRFLDWFLDYYKNGKPIPKA